MTEQIPQIVLFATFGEALQRTLLSILDPTVVSETGVSYAWTMKFLSSDQINQLIELVNDRSIVSS